MAKGVKVCSYKIGKQPNNYKCSVCGKISQIDRKKSKVPICKICLFAMKNKERENILCNDGELK